MNGDDLSVQSRKIVFIFKTLIIFFLAIFAIGIGIYFYIKDVVESNKNSICQGIWIENISVGGLTKEEAKKKLQQQIQKEEYNKKITLFYEDNKWILPYSKWSGTYNYDEIIHQGFLIGHRGNLIERYKEICLFSSSDYKKKLSLTYTYNEKDVYRQIEPLAQEIYKQPKNAVIKRKNGKFEIQDEVLGVEMDVESTTKEILALISERKEGDIQIVVNRIFPTYTKELFTKIQYKLGSFSTRFNAKDQGRTANLIVAASKINGYVLDVNEVFSLNKQLSPFTYEAGYREAPVIVNGELVPDFGGGVCQIASTLYNSVLFANLKVEERSNHSLPVSYVDLGRDATIAGNQIDFKFRNTTAFPVYIESYVKGNQLYAAIYGHQEKDSNYTVKFESVIIEKIPPPVEKVIYDPKLEKDQRVVVVKPIEGKKVKLYKSTYDKNNKLISRELVNTSYYRPRGGEVHIGTWVNSTSESEAQ